MLNSVDIAIPITWNLGIKIINEMILIIEETIVEKRDLLDNEHTLNAVIIGVSM